MTKTNLYNGTWYQGDCLEVMKDIPDNSIDMILCDLPYGTTACNWDTIIPFEPLWEQYHRIAKERAAIVLTASQPFTTHLIMSNIKNFKYEWIWNKHFAANFVQAKRQPMKDHENVLVFCKGKNQPNYYPIMTKRDVPIKFFGNTPTEAIPLKTNTEKSKDIGKPIYTHKNPTSFTSLNFSNRIRNNGLGFHPTQKPVALFEYLIKTYTNENDIVLDNCAGSGTTAVAAENTKRKWICIEQDKTYSEKAIKRIKKNHIPNAFREI